MVYFFFFRDSDEIDNVGIEALPPTGGGGSTSTASSNASMVKPYFNAVKSYGDREGLTFAEALRSATEWRRKSHARSSWMPYVEYFEGIDYNYSRAIADAALLGIS